jgi:hypothetical protein
MPLISTINRVAARRMPRALTFTRAVVGPDCANGVQWGFEVSWRQGHTSERRSQRPALTERHYAVVSEPELLGSSKMAGSLRES